MMYFVWLEDRHSSPVVQLDFEDWTELRQEVAFLESKTGVYLDPYSDTRLAPDHAKLLMDAIRARPQRGDNIQKLVELLDQCVTTDRWMIAVGD
jgi:hypothetical protein